MLFWDDNMNIIEAVQLTKVYHTGVLDVHALKDVSLSVKQGEFVAITGRSGSGKSTLLYQLGLLDHPTSGSVQIDGVETIGISSHARTSMRLSVLGYVFQDYALIPSLTALENILVPLLMQGDARRVAEQKAKDALQRVRLLDRANNLPSQMSGGQQQRVSIARAIAHSPKIVFADEPTANLDSETSRAILDTFLDLHAQGQTIVMVTHEPEFAALSQREVVMSDGAIINTITHKKS
jgi:putative ABC transport system ATP-binding protein